MKDNNAVIKNLDRINKLGWFVELVDSGLDWVLTTFAPSGRKDFVTLSNEDFLEDLEAVIDWYDVDAYIKFALEQNPRVRYSILFKDSEYFYNKLTELYKVLTNIDGFKPEEDNKDECRDTGEESKEPDKQGDKKTS